MFPILFKAAVRDAARAGGQRIDREIQIFAVSLDDAKTAYYTKVRRQEVQFVAVVDVSQVPDPVAYMKVWDFDGEGEQSLIVSQQVALEHFKGVDAFVL